MRRRILPLAAATLLAMSAGASPATADPGDQSSLLDRCEANTQTEAELSLCRLVVQSFLDIPTSTPPEEIDGSTTDQALGPTIGDSQSNGESTITLVELDWNPSLSYDTDPDPGMRHVAALVRHEAIEDGAYYNAASWEAADALGFRYNSGFPSKEPSLVTGDLAAGRKVLGWVTFQVPEDAEWLEIIWTSPEDLIWTVVQ